MRVIETYFQVNESAPHPPPASSKGFNESYIQHLVAAIKSGRNVCHYKCSSKFFNAFKEFPIKGKSVVILGSMLPWAEAHCLAAEAALVTTVDYNDPHFEHPGLRFWYPHHLSRTEELFDAAISYSSFEHDGLGRYGDPLHPTADLLRMKQASSKACGTLTLAVVPRVHVLHAAHRLIAAQRHTCPAEAGWMRSADGAPAWPLRTSRRGW